MKTHDSFHVAILAGTLVLLASLAARAQQYTIDWSKIAGGGTMQSTGSVYGVSGTIGQQDAGGPLSGASFTLLGGFWVLPTELQTPPLLSIEQLAGGVRVFWSAPATGFSLDESSTLASSPSATLWSLVPIATYQTNATHISITVPMPSGSKFYRLRKP